MRVDANSIQIEDVLPLLDLSVKKEKNGEITVKCPLNPDVDFEINVKKGFKCWKPCGACPCSGKGGAVQLYRVYNPSLTFREACNAIAERVKSVPIDERETFHQKVVSVVEDDLQAPIEVRDKTYRALLKMLCLSDEHKKDLLKRGLSAEQIKVLHIRSIPSCGIVSVCENLIAQGYTLKGVPGFGMKNGIWQMCITKVGGYLIPYFDEFGRISQLQIRHDIKIIETMSEKEVKEAKQKRYRWFTSTSQPEGCAAKNILFEGHPNLERQKSDKIYLTEGGLKATIATALTKDNFVALTGVHGMAQFEKLLEWCKKNNKTIVECFDMDGKLYLDEEVVDLVDNDTKLRVRNACGDRIVNNRVKVSIDHMKTAAKNAGVIMNSAKWDPSFKGIDDYLLSFAEKGLDAPDLLFDDIRPTTENIKVVPQTEDIFVAALLGNASNWLPA